MTKWLLLVIFMGGFLLRTVNLGKLPYGFTPDEASFVYDAYSIIETGKDQWGKTLPLTFESFGDFKAPVLVYLTIPFVSLLGVVKEAVRLPNALLGSLAIIATYLLVKELGNLANIDKKLRDLWALFAALFLAFSPWHVMMSRGGFEANLTTFFLPFGTILFLYGLKKYPALLSASAIIFGINMFTYHSAKVVTPILVFFLIFIFWKNLRKIQSKAKLILSASIFVMFLLIAVYNLFQGASTRAKDINIFKGSAEAAADVRFSAIMAGFPFTLSKVMHNKYLVSVDRFANNYIQYTSNKFLFSDGPAEATYGMLPGRGVEYWFMLPCLILSVYAFYWLKDKRPLIFILFWIIIAPVPAALASGPGYSANRAVVMLPGWQIFISLGAVSAIILARKLMSKLLLRLILPVCLFLTSFMIFSFVEEYFFLSPLKSAEAMLYGNVEVMSQINRWAKNKASIVVSKKLSEPQIYVAFSQKIDPREYQLYSKNWNYSACNVSWVDQIPEYVLGKYVFKHIDWEKDSLNNVLLVGRPDEFPDTVVPVAIIKFPNNKPAIYVVDPNLRSFAYGD